MTTEELIRLIQQSPKKTPVIALVDSEVKLPKSCSQILIGQQNEVLSVLTENQEVINNVELYCPARNSAIGPLNIEHVRARIEFGALIRNHVTIEDNAVIMMGAVLNVGCHIKEYAMIDMGAVIGARAEIGRRCHIGANAVISGVLEPPSANPVVIEDDVLVGACAVVLEGVHIHRGAVIAAGAVVIDDVEEDTVVAGCPAKIIKMKDKKTESKTQWVEALRQL